MDMHAPARRRLGRNRRALHPRELELAEAPERLVEVAHVVDHVARGRHQDEIDGIIAAWAAERQPADVIATLSAAGVISGPINTVAEVVTDPQLVARGMIADHWDERIGRNIKGPGVIPVLSETPGTIRQAGSSAPGQHNDEVFGTLLGRSPEELDALRAEGVL